MRFIGDIAWPLESRPPSFDGFGSDVVIANMEGSLSQGGLQEHLRSDALFNSFAVLPWLNSVGVRAVSLANNHALDLGWENLVETEKVLRDSGIQPVGAGANIKLASQPVHIRDGTRNVQILAFGWEVIGCPPAGPAMPGVSPLRWGHVLEQVASATHAVPKTPLVVMFHWGYELDLYPHPIHRELAHRCIDEGAAMVVGCHSHRAQGAEVYRDRAIVYGLGNWLLPGGLFHKGTLQFPSYCDHQIALNWSGETGEYGLSWYRYLDSTRSIEYVGDERLESGPMIRALTPFAGMEHGEYRQWYRANRRRWRALPVYDQRDGHLKSSVSDVYMAWRTATVRSIRRVVPRHLDGE